MGLPVLTFVGGTVVGDGVTEDLGVFVLEPPIIGDRQLIGNFVARHMKNTLNWGLASAMGVILLASILILYWVYDKLVGVDNLKMG